jgi:PAS domain S-box-containing protein
MSTGNNPKKYPVLPDEAERLAALNSYHILDTAEEEDFDDLTVLAAAICHTPIALVSLVDQDRQWFKSHTGLATRETPREQSFCAHAIASPGHAMIVPDATKDDRFADNPLVTGELGITFYAGVPLVNDEGFALGSLCVIDRHSHELSESQLDALTIIAKQVIDKLELRRKVSQLQQANHQLQISNAKLHENESQLRTLVDEAPVAISILKGREMVIESANMQILKIWGKDISVIGKPLHMALPELAGQPFLQLLDQVFTEGKPYYGYEEKVTIEHKGKLIDGFFNFVYKPLADEHGNTLSVMVVATDVTEQVDARKAVAEMNQRLNIALDAGELGITEVDLTTGNMSATEEYKKHFGRSKDDNFTYPDLFDMILPQYRDKVKELAAAAQKDHTIYRAEYQVKWPDGSVHWISAHGRARYDDDGVPNRMVGVTQDITGRKEFDQRKDDFLGIISHELKTPITSLKANLQLLDKLKADLHKPIVPKLIDASARSMEKINVLVDDLLNMNSFNEGQLQLNKKRFTISEMLDICCSHVRVAGKHDLLVQGDKLLQVYADEHRIDQVIVNLVNNAVKYAPDSKEIYMTVSTEGDFAKIAVKDNGPGIPADQLPRLFDRYWRADHGSSTYTGMGLGLYICAEIIKKHGGKIGAESELGKGSTFWFTIPLN